MIHLGVQRPLAPGPSSDRRAARWCQSRLGIGAGQQLVQKHVRNAGGGPCVVPSETSIRPAMAAPHTKLPTLPNGPRADRAPAGPHGSAGLYKSRCAPHVTAGYFPRAPCWSVRANSPAGCAMHNSRWPIAPEPRTAHGPATYRDAHRQPEGHREATPKMSAAFLDIALHLRALSLELGVRRS